MRKQEKGITLIALIITIVVLLILAMVAIDAVRDGGIITHAERAANQMNKAQIEEKANLTKLEFTAEALMNKDLKMSKQEFRDALRKAFEIPDDMDTNNDDYIEVNEKYAVHIKNTNLDVEVVEITNAMKLGSLVSITYEPREKESGNGVLYSDFIVRIYRTMTVSEYKDIISADVSQAEKETTVLQALGSQYNGGQAFNNLDEAVVAVVNVEFAAQLNGTQFTNINDCLNGLSQALGRTVEIRNLYHAFFNDGDLTGTMEKDEFITRAYKNFVSTQDYITQVNYSIEVDGIEKYSAENQSFQINFNLKDKIGAITNNSTVKIIVKNTSNVEIASEILNIKNIASGNLPTLSTEEADGVWSYMPSNGMITKYTGTNKDVIIPAKIGDTIITSINVKAFYHRDDIKSITIPSTIEHISQYVFEGCTGLTSITIPESVTEIGMNTFDGCSNLTNIDIKGKLTRIEGAVFSGCTSLKNITIPETVESIGVYSFYGCSSLESVTILGNVTSISTDAFKNCNNLKNIYFKNSTWPSGQPWGATNATVSQLSQ